MELQPTCQFMMAKTLRKLYTEMPVLAQHTSFDTTCKAAYFSYVETLFNCGIMSWNASSLTRLSEHPPRLYLYE